MQIRTQIQAAAANRRLKDLKGRWASLQPVMEGPVADLLRLYVMNQFRTAGAYGGTPWEELSPKTLRRHPDRIGILRVSDTMYTSLLGDDPQTSVFNVGSRSMEWGSEVPYAAVHQYGYRHIPARPIFAEPMPEDFMRKLRNLIKGYMVTGVLGRP